jgi:RHS repeat-associated protein
MMNDGVHTYLYDAENRLIKVDAGATAIYTYDGEGHRASKDDTGSVNSGGNTPDPAGTTEFVYDNQGHLVHTEAPNSSTGWRGEVFAGNRHLATYNGGLVFDHADWLGTERNRDSPNPNNAQLPSNQNLTSLPFGDWLDNSLGLTSETTPLNFTGQYHDFESNLDFFGARYYASTTGRFTSPDEPLIDQDERSPQSWNLYAYVRNNPINDADPTGQACVQQKDGGYKDDGGPGQSCAEANDPKNNTKVAVTAKAPPSEDDQRISQFAGALNRYNVVNNTLKLAGAGALIGATGGAACYYLCPTATITTVGVTVSGVGTAGAPLVTNPNLQTIVNSLFQASDELPGGTAGAVTYELKMGDLLSQAGHSEKATTTITALTNLLKSGSLSAHDQMVARQLIQQLRDALATKPFGQNP